MTNNHAACQLLTLFVLSKKFYSLIYCLWVTSQEFAIYVQCSIYYTCQLTKAMIHNGALKKLKVNTAKGVLSWDEYEAGNIVLSDQFVVQTPCLLLKWYEREFVSDLIFMECQVFLGEWETVLSKICFEEWLTDLCVAELKQLHKDNGIFTANIFRGDCKQKEEIQTFSGIVQNRKMQQLKGQYTSSCIEPILLWFMLLHTRMIMGLMILLCGVLQSSIWPGFIIN